MAKLPDRNCFSHPELLAVGTIDREDAQIRLPDDAYAVRQPIKQLLEIALLLFRHANVLDQAIGHAIEADGKPTGFVIGQDDRPDVKISRSQWRAVSSSLRKGTMTRERSSHHNTPSVKASTTAPASANSAALRQASSLIVLAS